LESDCRSGVTFLFSHDGAETFAVGCSPRKREGRKFEANIVAIVQEVGCIGGITGPVEAWGMRLVSCRGG